MKTITRTSVTGQQHVYEIIGYKTIGTQKYVVCMLNGAKVLLPV